MGKKWRRMLLLAALVLLAAAALDPRMIARTYTVESEKIDAPVRLALLTDFHGCDYGEDASRLVNAVNELQPDAVLLVGDIFDDKLAWDDSEALVRSLAAEWPCFYVTGNHEYWSNRVEEICRIVRNAGAKVLEQNGETIILNGQRISFCGVPDPSAGVNMEGALRLAAADAEPGAFTVLLAHRPELIEKYAANGAFDLVVSGHAHGGQIRIPGLVNGLYAPNQGWFPEYAGGLYAVDGMTMIVSRGLARESTLFPRIFNRPELVLIELR